MHTALGLAANSRGRGKWPPGGKRGSSSGTPPLQITAPTLARTSPNTDATPIFSAGVTDPIPGDTLTLQWSATSTFDVIMDQDSNVLTAGQITAAAFNLTSGVLEDGTYYFRLRHSRSNYIDGVSAVLTVTIAV